MADATESVVSRAERIYGKYSSEYARALLDEARGGPRTEPRDEWTTFVAELEDRLADTFSEYSDDVVDVMEWVWQQGRIGQGG